MKTSADTSPDVSLLLKVRAKKDEVGDTLVEVLVAIIVLGIAAVAIFGAYTMSIVGSAQHRTMASLDVGLRNIAEAATYQIQTQQIPSPPLYSSCASVSGTVSVASSGILNGGITYNGSSINLGSLSLPPSTSYSLSDATSIQYWDGSSWGTGCAAGNFSPQLITVTGFGPHGIINHLSFVVADEAYRV